MKRFIFLLGFIVTITILGGCATSAIYVDPGHEIKVDYTTINKPDIGIVANASIGESMVKTLKKRVIPTLVLNQSITQEYQYNGFTNYKTIDEGDLNLNRKNSEGRFFAAQDGVRVQGPGSVVNFLKGGIFVYDDKTTPPEMYFENKYNSDVYTELLPKFDFKIINKEEVLIAGLDAEENKKDSLNRELVYTGISGNTVSILYREYINNLARPAFTQEIKYDLKTSKIIGFKTARFEIIKADNASITYKTLSHL